MKATKYTWIIHILFREQTHHPDINNNMTFSSRDAPIRNFGADHRSSLWEAATADQLIPIRRSLLHVSISNTYFNSFLMIANIVFNLIAFCILLLMLPLPNTVALILQFMSQPAVTTADYNFYGGWRPPQHFDLNSPVTDLDILKCQILTAEQTLPLLEQKKEDTERKFDA